MAKYLMPAARNLQTKQLVKRQELTGLRYGPEKQDEVWAISQSLAEDLSKRTRQQWQAEPITYTDN